MGRPVTNRPGGLTAAQRPSALPGTAGARPTTPATGQRPSNLMNRPGAGGGAIAQRPGITDRPAPRPGGLIGSGTRPATSAIGAPIRPGDIANRPGAGGSGTQLPGIASRPGAGGGGTASTLPANILNRPGAGGSGTQLPGIANRPGAGGGGTASTLPANILNRPGAGGSGTQWRPGENRPDWNRPGWNGGGTAWRPGDNTRPRPGGIFGDNNSIGSGNTFINRPGANINTGNINSGNLVNNNLTQNNFANFSNNNSYFGNPGYYGNAYGNWYSGSWGGWPAAPAAWAVGTTAAGWLGAAANYSYSNPYATDVPVVSQVFNYTQPIPAYTEPAPSVSVDVSSPPVTVVASSSAVPGVAAAPATAPPDAEPPPDVTPEDPKVTEAVSIFNDARALFLRGDYPGAQTKVEKAIDVLPQDRVLHEFRGLTLFAQGKYSEAAATLYAVMSAGPGWNWESLKTFYLDPATYTEQLRTLEAHAKANAQSADDRFVLAYHYLVLGQNDAAARELEQVTKLLPKDQLSAQLLAALKPKPSEDGRPAPGVG